MKPPKQKKTVTRARSNRDGASTKRSRRIPCKPSVRTFGLEDAPIEAWQQAMLPHLQQRAATMGFDGVDEPAFVFLSLLQLKPFKKIVEFKDWMHRVTGYPRYEIDQFVDRAIKGFLIVDGQPNAQALPLEGNNDEEGYVSMTLLVKLLQGRFCRHADGTYSLPLETT